MIERLVTAYANVPADAPLDIVAARLSKVMPELSLSQAPTGRRDKAPAYIGQHDGVKIMLFDVPDGKVGNYELQLRCETNLPIDTLLARNAGGILGEFVGEEPVKNKTYMDYSVELARVLVRRGIAGCTPVLPAYL